MIKAFFTYLLLLLSLLASSHSYVDAKVPSDIEEEKIFAHCDKNFYICGQIIWFKIYVTGPHSLKLQPLSRTAYAELTGPDGVAVLQTKIELQNGLGEGSFLLPVNAKSGNYELKAYTNRMKNHPASIFKKSITIVNTLQTFDTTAFVFIKKDSSNHAANKAPAINFNPDLPGSRPSDQYPLTIITGKQTFRPRSIVNLEVQPVNKEEDIAANFSMAVYKLNALTAPGALPDNKVYTSLPQPVLQDGQVFLPEMDGFVIVAGVKDEAGNPISKVPLTISLAGKLTNVKYGISDEKGFAYFNFKDVYGPQQILIKTTPEYEKTVRLEILRSFIRPQQIEPHPRANFKEAYLEIVEEMHNHLEVTKAFQYSKDLDQYFPQNRDSISFYGKADAIYLLDNYKRFVTMEEVLREYVLEVAVRIRNSNYSLLVWNKQIYALSKFMNVNPFMDNLNPLILLDGIPITPNKLIKYDPLKVRKLEVLSERYFIGKNLYDGILAFTTYEGNFPGLELEKNELLSDEPGWQYKRKFFVPDYTDAEVKNNRKPDFRELLYWEPQINLSNGSPAKTSFFTGDLTGEFLVEIQGLTTDGRAIHEFTTIEVKE